LKWIFFQGDIIFDSGCYTEPWSWREAMIYRRKEVAVRALFTDFRKPDSLLALHVLAHMFHHMF
jgi:hypothetical protein